MILFPNIFGGYDTRDLPRLTVAQVGEDKVMADIQRWADFYNQVVRLYEDVLATRTTEATGNFGTGGGGGEMQPYVEYGETEATRTTEAEWGWGAPILRKRDRQMYTEEYIATKSLEQIQKDTIYATTRNLTSRLKMILRALLGTANYVFNDREFPGQDKGPITVYRLFNADGATGTMTVNNTIVNTGTMQSYVPSATATLTIASFNLGRAKLRERGYTGRVIHVISPDDVDTVRAIAGFYEKPRPTGDSYVQTLPASATPAATVASVTRPEAIGSISNGGAGDGEVWVFPFFPALYTFTFDATKEVPVVIREHPDAQFQGFKLRQDQTKAPYGEMALRNKRWEWIAGAGVKNRANGVAVQVTTNGTYTAPNI